MRNVVRALLVLSLLASGVPQARANARTPSDAGCQAEFQAFVLSNLRNKGHGIVPALSEDEVELLIVSSKSPTEAHALESAATWHKLETTVQSDLVPESSLLTTIFWRTGLDDGAQSALTAELFGTDASSVIHHWRVGCVNTELIASEGISWTSNATSVPGVVATAGIHAVPGLMITMHNAITNGGMYNDTMGNLTSVCTAPDWTFGMWSSASVRVSWHACVVEIEGPRAPIAKPVLGADLDGASIGLNLSLPVADQPN